MVHGVCKPIPGVIPAGLSSQLIIIPALSTSRGTVPIRMATYALSRRSRLKGRNDLPTCCLSSCRLLLRYRMWNISPQGLAVHERYVRVSSSILLLQLPTHVTQL